MSDFHPVRSVWNLCFESLTIEWTMLFACIILAVVLLADLGLRAAGPSTARVFSPWTEARP